MKYFCFQRNVQVLLTDDEGPVKTSSIWREFSWNISRTCIVRGENLEGIYYRYRHWGAGKFGRVRNPYSKAHRKENNYVENEENLKIPITDRITTLSDRDHEIQEFSLRRDQLVRSEDLREELPGNSERSQSTELKRWRRGPKWLMINPRWLHLSSLQVDPRFQLYVSEEETLSIPLKCFDDDLQLFK